MGFFDRFGAGGGKLDIQPSALQFAQGQVVTGTISFTSGSRPQQITNIKAKLTQSLTHTVQTPQGPQQRTDTKDICPPVTLVNNFTTEPGKRYDFPMNFQLPAQLPGTAQGQCSYRITVSADIDNEIDPGDGQDITIIGGPVQSAQPMMGMQQPMMGQPMQQPMMGQPMQQPMMGQPMGMQPPMMQPPMPPMPPQVGAQVMGQWQDGNWYPGRVVQINGNMIGVDWDNPQLGQSTWLQPHQVQVPQPMMQQPMMQQPMMQQPMMQQPMMQQPMMKQPMMGGQLGVGSLVYAQYQDGSVHPGKIIQVSGDQYAIDWENPKLGASAWVKAMNVKPR